MVEEKRCPGCGAILQTLDDQEQGYIPATLYNREDAICQRCFKLRHYGQFFTVPTVGKEYEKLLITANKEQNLLVYVIDLFNFDGSIIGDLMDYVP
ncbi:ribosome biogenesis GTPase YqeH, partial [bacterium]|nr:ribosome biogenesis GTPase YqeH [bacterium]